MVSINFVELVILVYLSYRKLTLPKKYEQWLHGSRIWEAYFLSRPMFTALVCWLLEVFKQCEDKLYRSCNVVWKICSLCVNKFFFTKNILFICKVQYITKRAFPRARLLKKGILKNFHTRLWGLWIGFSKQPFPCLFCKETDSNPGHTRHKTTAVEWNLWKEGKAKDSIAQVL